MGTQHPYFGGIWLGPVSRDRRDSGFNILRCTDLSVLSLDFGRMFGRGPRVSGPNMDKGLCSEGCMPNLVDYLNGEIHTDVTLLLY